MIQQDTWSGFMRNTLIPILLLITSYINSYGQHKRIPLGLINDTYNKQFLIKEDSLVNVINGPIVCVDYFQVKFTDVFFDENDGKMRLMGKSFYHDTSNSVGWGGVQIFKAKIEKNSLNNVSILGETIDTKDWSECGKFDITFYLKPGESLFFYFTSIFYLEEFKLAKLLPKNESICPRIAL